MTGRWQNYLLTSAASLDGLSDFEEQQVKIGNEEATVYTVPSEQH